MTRQKQNTYHVHPISLLVLAFAVNLLASCSSLAYRPAKSYALKNTTNPKFAGPPLSIASGQKLDLVDTFSDRQMVYSAWLTIVVQRVDETLRTIAKEAKAIEGYVQLQDENTITLKIPVKSLDPFLTWAESLGTVSHRKLYAEDVTDKVKELDIRLKNALEMHKRLLALIEKGGKVEDLLKIEKEIQRMTETIELLKGEKALVANQIAFSSVQITLNASIPQDILDEAIPFDWVKELAGDMVTGKVKDRWSQVGGKHVTFELPKNFATYHESGFVTRATAADGVLLKVSRHENFKGGTLEFWSELVRNSLVKKYALSLGEDVSMTIRGNKPAVWMQGTREVNGKKQAYILMLAVNDDYVFTFEAWGKDELVNKHIKTLKVSAESVKTGGWF